MNQHEAVLPAPRKSGSGVIDFFSLMTASFEEMRARTPLLPALVLIMAINLATAYALRPILGIAFNGEQAAVAGALQGWLWLTAIFSPVLTLTKALLLAAVAWAAATVLDEAISMRQAISVLIYAEIALALGGAFTVLGLYLRGLHRIAGPADLILPLGLNAIIETANPVLAPMLAALSVFRLIWAVFLWFALQRVAGLSRIMATIVLSLLVGGVLLTVGLRGWLT